MDRRTIIEEAAGITNSECANVPPRHAWKSARSNLSRVSDIIAEIERQVNSLRRQAARRAAIVFKKKSCENSCATSTWPKSAVWCLCSNKTQTHLDSALKKIGGCDRVGPARRNQPLRDAKCAHARRRAGAVTRHDS